jgi:two pore calcium channel protein 3
MAVILWLIIELSHSMNQELEQYLDLLLILRVLRLCKIITTIKRFKIVVKTIIALVPSFLTYIGLLFVVYYCYALVGMRLFNNLRDDTPNNCQNDNINCCPKNETFRTNYCSINFNTFPNAMLFLFDLMVVNQWHILARNQELLVGTKFSRIYFMSFHLICVILVLNIFTAFVLEAFILEYINITDKTPKKSYFQLRLEQIGLNCAQKRKQSLNNSNYIEIEDLVDADHDFIDTNNFNDEQQSSDSIITLKVSDLRIIIREKKSVESLLIKMFQNEILTESQTISDFQY